MNYQVAEKFKSLQGEGVYAGTPMAFIRFVGCSVGKKICQHCDTIFEKTLPWQGGGEFSEQSLYEWTRPYSHVCLTGGEPCDWDLTALFKRFLEPDFSMGNEPMIHMETSGTAEMAAYWKRKYGNKLWLCVSPKPGYIDSVVQVADEIKIIVPGLGNGDGWPTIVNAQYWAHQGKTVFLQPRNAKFDVDKNNLRVVQEVLRDYPELRLSVQMHKILGVM